MNQRDVIVVGGGPIGCFTAKKIAQEGASVVVVEEHDKIGVPMHCAGLVTPRVLDAIDEDAREDLILNKVKGAVIHSPGGKELYIGGDRVHALVLDRVGFDRELAMEAESEDVDIRLGVRVDEVRLRKGFPVEMKALDCDDFSSKLLVGADGPFSIVRRAMNIESPVEMLHGIGAEMKNCDLESDMVHIFVGQRFAPGFFAWVIPKDEEGSSVRVGLCVRSQEKDRLKECFDALLSQPLLNGAEVVGMIGGAIPLGMTKRTYGQNALLVGDAASQVKATSGGGLYTGLRCASFCASTITEALEVGPENESILSQYHTRWMGDIGHELSRGMMLRSWYRRCTDEIMEKGIEALNQSECLRAINEYGDIDYPSKLVSPLLRACPSLVKLAPGMVASKMREVFHRGGGGT